MSLPQKKVEKMMEREAGSKVGSQARGPYGFTGDILGASRWERRFPRVLVGFIVAMLIAQPLGLIAKEKKVVRVVSGVVSDASENPISGAVVTLTDLRDSKKTATYTGQSGTYQFSDLQLTRDYEVQASYKGVSSRLRKISSIDPRNRIVMNLRIPPLKEEE